MDLTYVQRIIYFKPVNQLFRLGVNDGSDNAYNKSTKKCHISTTTSDAYEACKYSATELVDVVKVEQLRVVYPMIIIYLLIGVLVIKDCGETSGGARNNSVHNHLIRPHNIVSNFCRTSIHKKTRYQNYEGTGHKKIDVLIGELSILVWLVNFKDHQNLLPL